MKRNIAATSIIIALTLCLAGFAGAQESSKVGELIGEIIKTAAAHHQEPGGYAREGGYYPYSALPADASLTARSQHAYDVGYRVGQDDFHQHFSKHFTRHPKLYDRETRDSFVRGYEAGYDIARSRANAHDRHYGDPQPAAKPVRSKLYPSGYYPYSPAPKEANLATRQRHAYDVGFKVGQDDFHGGHSKHFTRHQELFDKDTKHNFVLGYEHGFDKAREQAKQAQIRRQSQTLGVRAVVGQGRVTVKDGARTLCVLHTASANVEKYDFSHGKTKIVVKSRGNHGPATVELFDVRTGTLEDKILAYAIKGGRPSWARGMED